MDLLNKSFDFDEWKNLAERDPKAFERQRKRAIDEVIASSPESAQGRLRGLQWQIDMQRGRSSNPTQSCLRVYRMMWDVVCGQRGLIAAINGLDQQRESASAKVIAMRPNPDNKRLT